MPADGYTGVARRAAAKETNRAAYSKMVRVSPREILEEPKSKPWEARKEKQGNKKQRAASRAEAQECPW